jgi:altronate dehydratase
MSASGTAIADFGTWANRTDEVQIVITGQGSILGTSQLGAWPRLEATADHSIDEIRIEEIDVEAGNINVGTGFTIYIRATAGRVYGQYKIDWAWS